MKIVLTGSLGNISKPLAKQLITNGHTVTVISSKAARIKEIEQLGATAAIGALTDSDFLTKIFTGADVVYLMEPPVHFSDPNADTEEVWKNIAKAYSAAISKSGVTKAVHLSSIGAHTNKGVGILSAHYYAEQILRALPDSVSIKFIRPVGFYGNLLSYAQVIKQLSKGFVGIVMALQHYGVAGLLQGKRGVIVSNYDADVINLLVSPIDIAAAVAEEIEKPFEGRSVRYVASEELTGSEVARILGQAIGKPYLKHGKISDKMLKNAMLKQGLPEKLATGLVEMNISARNGKLYEDYYKNRPVLSKTKLKDFVNEFALAYKQN